jgi:tRNA splicing endonuclease
MDSSAVKRRMKRGRVAAPERRPLDWLQPVLLVLRDDCLEVVREKDMLELFAHGYFGKGAVFRRQPVVMPIFPTSASAPSLAVAAVRREPVAPPMPRPHDPKTIKPLAPERRSGRSRAATGTVSFAPVLPGDAQPENGALNSTPSRAHAGLDDHLTLLALEFESHLAQAPIPSAFFAAAGSSAHGNDPVSFESARQITHYVSCPPGRDSGPAVPWGAAPTVHNEPTGDGGTDAPPLLSPPPGELRASESAVLEPEAALYLLDLLGTAKIHVIVHPDQASKYASLLGWPTLLLGDQQTQPADRIAAPLSFLQLWRVFCARLPNFPAKFAVYRHLRTAGWVVRDGAGFGADFSLYSSGPGIDHSVHTVLVMPLQVIEAPAAASAAVREASGSADASALLPPIAVRASPWSICPSWVETHAHGRVIGSVRKHMVLAYASFPVDASEAATSSLPELSPCGTSAPLAEPTGHAGQGRGGVATEIEDTAAANADVYPPWLSARLADPACLRAMLPIEVTGLSRWIISVELANKSNAMLATLSQLATQAALEDGGVEIDLGAIINKRPKLDAAARKAARGAKPGAEGDLTRLSAVDAAERRKKIKAEAALQRAERAAERKAAAEASTAGAAAAAAACAESGAPPDARDAPGDGRDPQCGSSAEGGSAPPPEAAAPLDDAASHSPVSRDADSTGGAGVKGDGITAPAAEAVAGKRKRAVQIQHNPLSKWEKKLAREAKREEKRAVQQQHKVDVRRQIAAVLKGKQRAAASLSSLPAAPPRVLAVVFEPQFDDADPDSNVAADVVSAALALPTPAMDGSTFRFVMGDGASAPTAEVRERALAMCAAAGRCAAAGLHVPVQHFGVPEPAAGDSVVTSATAALLAVPSQIIEVSVPRLTALATRPRSAQHASLVSLALAGLNGAGSGGGTSAAAHPTLSPVASDARESRSWYVDRKLWVQPQRSDADAAVAAAAAAEQPSSSSSLDRADDCGTVPTPEQECFPTDALVSSEI